MHALFVRRGLLPLAVLPLLRLDFLFYSYPNLESNRSLADIILRNDEYSGAPFLLGPKQAILSKKVDGNTTSKCLLN